MIMNWLYTNEKDAMITKYNNADQLHMNLVRYCTFDVADCSTLIRLVSMVTSVVS